MADATSRIGRATVRARGFAELARRARLAAVEQAGRSLLERGTAIIERARARWPVDTGRSRAGLEFRVLTGPQRVRLIARDEITYTEQVRIRGSRGQRAWLAFVVEPITRVSTDAGAIAREVDKAVSRIVRVRGGRRG